MFSGDNLTSQDADDGLPNLAKGMFPQHGHTSSTSVCVPMVLVPVLFDKLSGMAAFNEAATGKGAEDGTVDKSRVALESTTGAGSGVVANPDINRDRMPNGLT